MAKPLEFHWNPQSARFESKGRDGLIKAYVSESGLGADNAAVGSTATIRTGAIARLAVGGGETLTKVHKFVGTSLALAAVGTGIIAVGTILGAVCAVGDSVFGVPKTDRSAGGIGIAGFRVPTTNVINILVQNSIQDSAGSYPGAGFDMTVFSSA